MAAEPIESLVEYKGKVVYFAHYKGPQRECRMLFKANNANEVDLYMRERFEEKRAFSRNLVRKFPNIANCNKISAMPYTLKICSIKRVYVHPTYRVTVCNGNTVTSTIIRVG